MGYWHVLCNLLSKRVPQKLLIPPTRKEKYMEGTKGLVCPRFATYEEFEKWYANIKPSDYTVIYVPKKDKNS